MVVGDTVALTGESRSTATLELQGGQVALLDALAATGTPDGRGAAQLQAGRAAAVGAGAAAIVQAFNPGMRGGRAMAELLLGLIEPTGRLPISAARHVGQQPVYYNQIRGQHGTRYADLTQEPLFAFGEGLSYTTIEYADLTIAQPEVTAGRHGPGERPADQHRLPAGAGDRAGLRQRPGHQRDLGEPGAQGVPAGGGARGRERRRSSIEVPAADCSLVTADARRVVEPGDFELLVGPNSRPGSLLSARFRIG